MSNNLDENPFGEPVFDDPFKDVSIQQVAANTSMNNQNLDNYDPFSSPTQSAPPTLPATTQAVPSFPSSSVNNDNSMNNAHQQINTAELQRRQEELERKARELDRREAELLRNSNTAGVRRNNWPPLPDNFPVQACFYHDIETDIPSEFQKIVKNLYHVWILYAATLSINMIGCMLLMFLMQEFKMLFTSIIYLLVFVPASFLCWYRPAYKAFKDDSSANFMLFFFVFFFQIIILILQTIGFLDAGTMGIHYVITLFSKGGVIPTLMGIYGIVVCLGLGASSAGSVLLIMKIHALYRSTGASMDKGVQEFQREFFRNQTVQQAAQDLARNAVQSEMSRNRY